MIEFMPNREIWTVLGLQWPRRLWADGIWWGLLAAGLLLAVLLFPLSGLDPVLSLPVGTAQWGAALLWQPLLEELLFRGLLQGLLLEQAGGHKTLAGITRANWIATLAFAAMHFLYHPPLWALAVVPPSLVFGWLRERHRSVWPAALAHCSYNAGFFAGALLALR